MNQQKKYVNREDKHMTVYRDDSGKINVVDKDGRFVVKENIITQYGELLHAGKAGETTRTSGLKEALDAMDGEGTVHTQNVTFELPPYRGRPLQPVRRRGRQVVRRRGKQVW